MLLSCLFHGLCAPLKSGHFLIRICFGNFVVFCLSLN